MMYMPHTSRAIALIAGLVVATPAMTHAQDAVRPVSSAPLSTEAENTATPIATLLPRNLDAATRSALLLILQRAREQGLPLSVLSGKAAEGVLRGIPSQRIVSAVTALKERMLTAQSALAPAEAAEIKEGAGALGVGVSVATLRDLRQRRPNTSVSIPLAVLTQLVAQGVPAANASAIVLRLLERGASKQQLVDLRNAVDEDISLGKPILMALDVRAANVLSTLAPRPLPASGGEMGTGATTTSAAAKIPH
jgi:hypothetical protein